MHSQKPLRLGLIGIGGYGSTHRKAIDRCREKGLAQLVAVADPTLHHREELRKSVEQEGIPWFADYREMLVSDSGIDAIAIAAPIPFHLAMAGDSVSAGFPVYLEKPPVALLEQLETLIALDPEKRVAVGFQFLNSRWSNQLKNWVVEGKLGEIQEIRAAACWPRADLYYDRASWAGKLKLGEQPVFDGPATNALSHLIHNMMFLASPVAGAYTEPVDVQAELYRARDIESYDLACLRGTLASGARYHVALGHPCKENMPYHIEIRGTKGWARYVESSKCCESSFGSVETNDGPGETMMNSYVNFVDYLAGKAPARTLLADTRGYMLATNGMLVSSGGIHTIDSSHVSRVAYDTSEICHLDGLPGLIRTASESGLLFSEMNLPWAVKTESISLQNLGADFHARMRGLLGLAPAPVAAAV